MMDYRIEQLRFQLREDPASRVFYQLGELLRRTGAHEEAITVLRSGLDHHPEYVAAWVSLGRALFEVGRYAESARALSRALELDPENAVAAQMLGRCGVRRGDWEEAVRGFALAVELIPGDEELVAELESARAHLPPETAPEESEVPDAGPGGVPGAEPVPDDEPAEEPYPAGQATAAGRPREEPYPAGQATAAGRPREVVMVSEEDPFAVGPKGDTGVFLVGGEIFESGEVQEEPGDGTDEVPEAVPEPDEVPVAGGPTRPIPVPSPDVEPGTGRELPLPTVTLARLALEQGDLGLAEETTRAVLDRDPDSEAARELLEEIRAARAAVPSSGREARVRRLETWLAGIRKAAERTT